MNLLLPYFSQGERHTANRVSAASCKLTALFSVFMESSDFCFIPEPVMFKRHQHWRGGEVMLYSG